MKIAILSETFAKNMGYLTNMLPKYLSRLGAEVHLVTLDLPPYHQLKDFRESYTGFISLPKAGTTEEHDGYYLHILPHRKLLGYMSMPGMMNKLREINPDVVYSIGAIGWLALQAALIRPLLGYRLFTGSHTCASVFPLANRDVPFFHPEALKVFFMRTLHGRFVSLLTEKCYGATDDCGDIAVRFFGVQKEKIEVRHLGVDTEIFRPVSSEADDAERAFFRKRFGFTDTDIVCIYTGRFGADKNPLLLGQAIAKLRERGKPFQGLFFGNGVQADDIRKISGCTVHPFVPVDELGCVFRAGEIAVWPTQESTSMLDAAACGLPIVVSDRLIATERVRGNGLQYRQNDVDDLVRALLELENPELRRKLGEAGAEKMATAFSWHSIAQMRLRDFEASLGITSEVSLVANEQGKIS